MFNQATLQRFYKTSPVTAVIMLAVTIMFFVTIITGGFTNQNLYDLGALFTPAVLAEGDYYRLFTVMFLHGSVMHFIFNTMFGLFLISSALERLIGSIKFSIIYFVSGIGASILIYVIYLITGTPSLGVGASGAIFGVLGSFFYLTYKNPEWFSLQDISSIRGLIFINLIFTFLAPNISIPAHVGGLVMGVILTILLQPKRHFGKKQKGFENPWEDNRYQNIDDLDEVIYVDDDDDDDDDPWGRYSA